MTWSHQSMATHAQILNAPSDGLTLSSQPLGWVGTGWRSLFDGLGKDQQTRERRGRNFARRGRVRGLHVAPGVASAEVVADGSHHASLKVRAFSTAEWQAIMQVLSADLSLVASLMEGELPDALVRKLDRRQVQLMPTLEELSFDCSCGDYVMPCAHGASVFHVLSDALDGDPFLLLTLRGRTPEHLMADLRAGWGDETAIRSLASAEEDLPELDDWFTARGGVPCFRCRFADDAHEAAGLKALGPAPGSVDLVPTLQPLYESARKELVKFVEELPERKVRRRPEVPVAAEKVPEEAPEYELTEAVVNVLAEKESTVAEILARITTSPSRLRDELGVLEELGLIFRTGRGEAVTYWLG